MRGLDTLTLPDDVATSPAGDVVEIDPGPGARHPAAQRRPAGPAARPALPLTERLRQGAARPAQSRDTLDEDDWEEIEDTLLTADMGVKPATELVEALRTRVRVLGARTPADVRALLRDELLAQVGTTTDRTLAHPPAPRREAPTGTDRPAVVLVVGVNGTGKTTTCGKLARVLVADGHTVLLGAADTFRAAAADQLETWGSRVGAGIVRGSEGADPASVAFEAVKQGIDDRRSTRC